MYLLGLTLLGLSFIMFFMSILVLINKMSFYIQWEVTMIHSILVEMGMIFDWMTFIFLSVVFIISSMVMFYSIGYMEGDMNSVRFFMLLFMFVMSMVFLICSPNMISILIGWDGLGLISYCLVIYYSSYMSYNYGMITFLCNRLGDVGILMLISLMMMNGSWNLMLIEKSDVNEIVVFMLVLSAMTKSAQIPFSTWLPKAMAAPTPVSSLVHSSTLVTAGVYLLIRYNYMLMGSIMGVLLLVLSSMTMLMAGIAANLENDLKKIIALSTLSQLGLMMSILSLGAPMLAFFHLLTHAMFKSLLFLSAGTIIHSFKGNQDVRLMGSLVKFMPFSVSCFFCASMSLGGFPFLSGFYSKDLIMEFMLMNEMNFVTGLMLMVGTLLTVSYSVRLMMFMIFGKGKFSSFYMIHNDYFMNLSMIILLLLSMFGGSFLYNLYFDMEDLIFLPLFYKLYVMIICMMGIMSGIYLYYVDLMNYNKIILEFLGSMWYVDKLFNYFSLNLLKLAINFFDIDKVWVENSSVSFFSVLTKMSYSISKINFNMFLLIKFMMMMIVLALVMIL